MAFAHRPAPAKPTAAVVPEVLIFDGPKTREEQEAEDRRLREDLRLSDTDSKTGHHDIYVDSTAPAVEVAKSKTEVPDLSGTTLIARSAELPNSIPMWNQMTNLWRLW